MLYPQRRPRTSIKETKQMGRPLNKKYFGNRNVGSSATTDNGIGGEGLAGVTVTQAGAYEDSIPSLTAIPAPSLPNGVAATGAITYSKASLATVMASGAGYQIGDILSDTNGTTWRVTAMTVKTVTKTAGGTNYDNDNEIWFDATIDSHWTSPLKLDVTGNTGGVLDTFTVLESGEWTGPGAAPLSVTCTTANTRGGVDQNASGAAFTLTWGVTAVELVTAAMENDDDGINTGSLATTASPAGGTGATVKVYYHLDHVTFATAGSGYTGSESITFTTSLLTTATGSLALTADTGAVGSLTNQENAIIAYAWVDGGREVVDIVKQSGSRKYTVKGADGTVYHATLVAAESAADGELDLTAFDADNNEYWVTKLTAHKALLTRKVSGSGLFASGTSVPWTLTGPAAGYVKIANA